MQLAGKHILLGVTGSISAYKAAELCRLLVKEGAIVKVLMTEAATTFISPLTLSTLSKNRVEVSFKNQDNTWNNHVELGLWSELFLIAPASANTIAKMANGICDNLLLATYFSVRSPVMIAPAMDHDMYLHTATQQNLLELKKRNHQIAGPATGELASGLNGEGRLVEPDLLLREIKNFFYAGKLAGKRVLITAGPTQEAIDPVRFISNHSTGKMGVALAQAFFNEGADVCLIAGPLQVNVPSYIKTIFVTSTDEMYNECMNRFPDADIGVMAAAVADFKPIEFIGDKVKKKDADWNLALTKTKDIAKSLGAMKTQNQFLVGFALETSNELKNASEKLIAKNMDLIILNSMKDIGAGFSYDTNKITMIDRNNNCIEFPLKSKNDVAIDIVSKIIELKHA